MPSDTLRPLSRTDSARLDAWAAVSGDLAALSRQTGAPVADLARWTESPAVAPYLAVLRIHNAHASRLRGIRATFKALDALEHVAANSPDPVERRRAAALIIRLVIGHSSRSRRSQTRPHPRIQPDASPAPRAKPEPTAPTSARSDRTHAAGPNPNPRSAPAAPPVPTPGRTDRATTTPSVADSAPQPHNDLPGDTAARPRSTRPSNHASSDARARNQVASTSTVAPIRPCERAPPAP